MAGKSGYSTVAPDAGVHFMSPSTVSMFTQIGQRPGAGALYAAARMLDEQALGSYMDQYKQALAHQTELSNLQSNTDIGKTVIQNAPKLANTGLVNMFLGSAGGQLAAPGGAGSVDAMIADRQGSNARTASVIKTVAQAMGELGDVGINPSVLNQLFADSGIASDPQLGYETPSDRASLGQAAAAMTSASRPTDAQVKAGMYNTDPQGALALFGRQNQPVSAFAGLTNADRPVTQQSSQPAAQPQPQQTAQPPRDAAGSFKQIDPKFKQFMENVRRDPEKPGYVLFDVTDNAGNKTTVRIQE